ncbi:acylphosphatase [Desulfosediminicola flagellatus]|uniref:acylphosphatase n=1 Tax=Desulfosediminicola flagellatus TaxID=2569541 RepID=UPI0010ACA166|nr:acylphosphatase [Desulfosediminicola flagellatus]
MKTVHVIVHGRVQGVFFRDYTQRKANLLELSGWVKNQPDGSVEALLSGMPKSIDTMIEWFQEGSPQSTVTAVTVDEVIPTEKLRGFEIRY